MPATRSAAHTPHAAPPSGHAGPRRALVLAGGGMRVAWQAGVIRALLQRGLRFSHGDGTSGGIFNLAMLLSGQSPEEMCERWRTLDVRDFSSLLALEEYLRPHALMGLGDADGLTRRVFPHLGIDIRRINAARGMVGTFNVCNFTRKTVESVPHDRMELELMVAGVSLPILMPPVRRVNDYYTDAVWIKDANLMEAVRRGAEELWLVWCIGNTRTYRPGSFNQYVHMIEMSANGALFEELEWIREINERIRAGETVYGHTRPIRLHVVRPERALPLDPDLYFGNITTRALVALGYADAVRYLDAGLAQGVPLEPESTRMAEPLPAVTFEETMSGAFALGEPDPRAGERAGRAAGTRLSMHATVLVRDLDRFLRDPQHTGTLVGSVDFTPFGNDIPTGEGVFRLFSPTPDPRTKRMVYELPFSHEGQSYYLAGHKEVRDDRGPDAWSDLTTLFTRLHRGTDASGEVVGAGVLSLSAAEFTRVLRSIRAVDAATAVERAALLARFGRFFAGEVWNSYAPLASPVPPVAG